MKKIVLFIFIATLFPLQGQFVDWQWQHPKPAGNHINDMVVLDNGNVLFFSDNGGVGLSTNNGSQWTIMMPDTTAGNRDIYEADFFSSTLGYAVGTAGLVMKTTDGGQTWSQLTTGLTSNFWYVDFLTENLGFIGGSSGKLLKTTDGGASWTELVIGGTTSVLVYKIHAMNADTIYVGTGSATPGRLIRSTDGGATWAAVAGYTATSTVRGIYFVNPNTGFVGDAGYVINKTTDGGTTWIPIDLGVGTIYEIKFATDSLGFAAGADGKVFITTDQGTSWNVSFIGVAPTSNVFGMALGNNLAAGAKSNTILFAGGEGGFIVSSANSGSTWTLHGVSHVRDDMRAIGFVNDQFGYAAGGSATTADSLGVVLVTSDGGQNWTKLGINPKYRIYSADFVNTQVAYVGSRGGSGVYKTTDGGATWSQLTTPIVSTTNIWYTIKFWDETTGYLGDGSGNIVKTTDGGTTWTALPDPHGTSAIYSIQLFSATDLISSGSVGKTYRSTDGGATWTNLNPTTSTLYAMHFPSRQFGYIVGSSGRIVMTSNEGVTWNTQVSNSTATLYSVQFFNDSVGFVGGSGGVMLFTSDAGTTWTPYTQAPSNATFYSLAIRNGGLYATGSRGNIIKGLFNSSIPVELTSFSAQVQDGAVVLDWTTVTETNNARFIVERRTANETWQAIGSVKGAGTSTSINTYRYSDNTAISGLYTYRLKQVDYDGSYEYSSEVEVQVGLPEEFAMYQNYPNPFNPTTTIGFSLPAKAEVSLKIYDVLGTEVANLVTGSLEAGYHNVEFRGNSLASGVYLYKLQVNNSKTFVGKMNLMK